MYDTETLLYPSFIYMAIIHMSSMYTANNSSLVGIRQTARYSLPLIANLDCQCNALL